MLSVLFLSAVFIRILAVFFLPFLSYILQARTRNSVYIRPVLHKCPWFAWTPATTWFAINAPWFAWNSCHDLVCVNARVSCVFSAGPWFSLTARNSCVNSHHDLVCINACCVNSCHDFCPFRYSSRPLSFLPVSSIQSQVVFRCWLPVINKLFRITAEGGESR